MRKTIYLTLESESVQYLSKKDKRLAKVISMIGDISYKHYDNSYVFLVHKIIEQMLSVKSGQKMFNRLEEMCDNIMTPEKINTFSVEKIQKIGTSSAKVQYIKGLTEAVISGKLDFDAFQTMSDKEVVNELTKLKGIGEWTAHMYLIFVLIVRISCQPLMLHFCKHMSGCTKHQTVPNSPSKRNAKNGSPTLLLP